MVGLERPPSQEPRKKGGLGVRAEVDRAAHKGHGWECTSHPEKTLYQDAARRRIGRLAECAAKCD